MRNTIGENLTLSVFGESHGEKIGAVIDGLPGGVKIDYEYIDSCLALRRPRGRGETARVESDKYAIVSGVFGGYTTGTPLCIEIENQNTRSGDYEEIKDLARPSHADYVAHVKYNGYQDYRGGGHFSGRITAAIVAAGAIILKALENKNIKIGSHIKQCGSVCDADFSDFDSQIDKVNGMDFPLLLDVREQMESEIQRAAAGGDSVGGIVQTAISGLPVGIGEPMFCSLEGHIANAVFSIGGVKGVEFGLGFGFADKRGSEVNDSFRMDNGRVTTTTNNNGGINGGISNGMPVVFNCAIKPTPSIAKEQNTVNFVTNTDQVIKIQGRHDPAIIRRVNIVIRCITAFAVADMLAVRYGCDYLKS